MRHSNHVILVIGSDDHLLGSASGDQTRSTHVLRHDLANLPFPISGGVVCVSANARQRTASSWCRTHARDSGSLLGDYNCT